MMLVCLYKHKRRYHIDKVDISTVHDVVCLYKHKRIYHIDKVDISTVHGVGMSVQT